MRMRSGLIVALLVAATSLAGCNGFRNEGVNDDAWKEVRMQAHSSDGGIFGGDGILFGGKKSSNDDPGNSLGVNAFLWRSSLDTLSFMPLTQADPLGGVIITDWYQPPNGNGERFRATAYILGRQLRSEALRVAVYRQVMQGGQWVDSPVNPSTVTEIENRILAKAREMRAEVMGS